MCAEAQRDFITWEDLKLHDQSATLDNGGDRSRVIVVDQNGGGDSVTVQGAIDLVPENNLQRVKIHILPGIYREKVHIPANKPYITLIGDEEKSNETVITWHDKAANKTADGHFLGTWNSASVTVLSDYFCASWITFQNTIIVEADLGVNGYQAVALRIAGEHAMFYRARFLGSQDTLLDETGSHYFLQCFIQGTTDFIFVADGFAIAAHHRDSAADDTGFSFVNCTVRGTGDVFLGRAWGEYSRIIYAYTELDIQVRPQGWQDWGVPSRRNSAVFGLYECSGRGAERNTTEDWSKALNISEAMPFLQTTFIRGEQWLKL
ncbi:Pectin lyase-like superfamily protein [Perilla frutescens var. hirtella]|nr:Pectin lyase-like superfamily protein [Perilla frutescens var. frutescens]KAH6786256.1 Pectin lyase-like superfamily protein [Perilla frutescens var. hirtella]